MSIALVLLGSWCGFASTGETALSQCTPFVSAIQRDDHVSLQDILVRGSNTPSDEDDDCSALLKKINDVLYTSKLLPEAAARIEALRNKGAALYGAGQYQECMGPLRQAAQLMGMETP
jgi:hypothetical protein